MTGFVRSVALAGGVALLGAPGAQAVDPQSAVDAVVSVEGVRAEGCSVEAALRNQGPRELRDVRVLVECIYHWPTETRPGDASPGQAWAHVVPGPIAPGATESFRSTPPGGTPSSPGRFEPRVRVLGFSERGR